MTTRNKMIVLNVKACCVDDCSEDGRYRRRGWDPMCLKHYTRVRRHGSPYVKLNEASQCWIEGCIRLGNRAGLCGMHRQRQDPTENRRGRNSPGNFVKGHPPMGNSAWTHGQRVELACSGRACSYSQMHLRVATVFGKPTTHVCVGCGGVAEEWSYDHCDPDPRLGPRGLPYSLNVEHYEPRCKPCHRLFDGRRV